MPGKRKSEKERRDDIKKAIYTVAIRDGLTGVTLRAVAKEANLSHGLVGFYFPKKNDLLQTLFDKLLEDLYINSEAGDEKSTYLDSIGDSLTLSKEERPKIRLLLEFWILSLKEPEFKERIKETLVLSDKYYSHIYSFDKKSKKRYTNRFSAEELNSLTLPLIVGNALIKLIDDEEDVSGDILNYLFK